MFDPNQPFKKGNEVTHKTYGHGVVVSAEYVELPSDGDHTFYRVQMDDKQVRHFKTSELKSVK